MCTLCPGGGLAVLVARLSCGLGVLGCRSRLSMVSAGVVICFLQLGQAHFNALPPQRGKLMQPSILGWEGGLIKQVSDSSERRGGEQTPHVDIEQIASSLCVLV
ncbi:hypothetical protein AAFF_G00134430 [Aldrovandia affinis]|uniref:Uncharacterized protein n=1 Tax=Aldrovandia affinis TaxID=143900 RepID=A0AAD7VWG5_9TELE|nr:hypothetical protein AAFF_G00134430 [Aldrovandia affinis]